MAMSGEKKNKYTNESMEASDYLNQPVQIREAA